MGLNNLNCSAIDYMLETIFVCSLLFYNCNLKKIDISGSFNLLRISENKNKYVYSIKLNPLIHTIITLYTIFSFIWSRKTNIQSAGN